MTRDETRAELIVLVDRALDATAQGGSVGAELARLVVLWSMRALVLVVATVVGCGPSSRGKVHVTRGIAFVGTWTTVERAVAEDALRVHRDRFEARWGLIPSLFVELHRGDRLPSGATGEASPWSSSFRLAAGRDIELAGATHELHHLMHDPSVTHADPRWPSWDADDQAVVDLIRAGRP